MSDMLEKFAVTNYKGFKDRIEIDFAKTRNYEFSSYAIKDKVVKNAIFYGKNGSGKTNLGLAIFDLVYHLSEHSVYDVQSMFKPFLYFGSSENRATFEYCFRIDGDKIEYSYSKDGKKALRSEVLKVNDKLILSWEDEFYIDEKEFPGTESMKEYFKNRQSNGSIINFLKFCFPLPENNSIDKIKRFVNGMLWFKSLPNRTLTGLFDYTDLIDEYIIENDFLFDLRDFIFDEAGIDYTLVAAKDLSGKKVICCSFGDKIVPLSDIMSTGTESLLQLFYWYTYMTKCSFVFIDEFDAFYHFELAKKVCKLLFEKLDCQVFLTSHNTFLSSNDILRPDCNFLIDKGKIKPFCDCTDKELRFGNNIENMVRDGSFKV